LFVILVQATSSFLLVSGVAPGQSQERVKRDTQVSAGPFIWIKANARLLSLTLAKNL